MFLSIITACFNSAKTLSRTMDSILAQRFCDYEYIIVDGGSTDGTIDLIKKYELLFGGRLKWKSEKDKGIYDAFNKGIKQSRGQYIWIVNSDDYIEPDALDFINNLIREYNLTDLPVISGALRYFDEVTNKELYKEFISSEKSKKYYKIDSTCVVHPATLVPKQTYDRFGLYDDRFAILADCDFFHRLLESGQKIIFVDRILTNMSNAGISGQWTVKRYAQSFKDRKLYFKKNYSSLIMRYIKFIFWNIHFLSIYVREKFRE